MNPSRSFSFAPRSFRAVVAGLALAGLGFTAMAQAPQSLLPAFGTDGVEFTVKARGEHTVKGWLPKGWVDNTDWAPVTATYTKLTDSPDAAAGAVRIKVEQVDEGGQLQFTTYGGNQKYKRGSKYVVSGWVRSPQQAVIKVGVRQIPEPYEFYFENDLTAESEWKRFEFPFSPGVDFEAFIMFVVQNPGTVDLAGVTVEEKP